MSDKVYYWPQKDYSHISIKTDLMMDIEKIRKTTEALRSSIQEMIKNDAKVEHKVVRDFIHVKTTLKATALTELHKSPHSDINIQNVAEAQTINKNSVFNLLFHDLFKHIENITNEYQDYTQVYNPRKK